MTDKSKPTADTDNPSTTDLAKALKVLVAHVGLPGPDRASVQGRTRSCEYFDPLGVTINTYHSGLLQITLKP